MEKIVLLALAFLFLPPPAFALDKLKVGSSNATSSAAVFVAKEMGYFADEGIDAEIVIMKQSALPMTTLLANGELDVGAGVVNAGLFNAIGKGINLRLVADKGHSSKALDYIFLVIRKDLAGEYKGIASLKGKKIGIISTEGSSLQILLDKMLGSAGLSLKDVSLEKLSYAETNAAMKSKSIDAAVQIQPYVDVGEEAQLFVRKAGSSEYYPGQTSAAIIYGSRLLEKDRALGLRFMKAYLRGVRETNLALRDKQPQNRKRIIEILAKNTDASNPGQWEKMVPPALNDDGKMNPKALRDDLRWYAEHGFVTEKVDPNKIIDPWFAEQASQKISKRK